MQRCFYLSALLLFMTCGQLAHAQRTPAAPAGKAASERLALSEPTAAPSPAAAPVSFALQGQVLNADGQPLPGATVLVKSNKQVYISNSEGFFTFTTTHPTETVEISLAGYEGAQLQLRRGATDAVTLQLLPGTRIRRSGRHAGQIKTVGQPASE